jgi:WS/DGAT/MGAT family acyltransferase
MAAMTRTSAAQVASQARPRPLRFEHRMTDAETLMWMAERDPILRSAFQTVTFLDGQPDLDRFLARMSFAVEQLPRLRQRVVPSPIGPPTWEDDPDFDLRFHVRHIALPPPGDDRQLLEFAALHLQDPFDLSRPLWLFTVVEGLKGGRAALLSKLHHTISDGVGAVRLSAQFIDFEPSPPEPVAEPLVLAGTELEAAVSGPDTMATPEVLAAPEASTTSEAGAAEGSVSGPAGLVLDALEVLGERARVPLDLGRRAVAEMRELVSHPSQVPRETADAFEAAQATIRQLLVTEPAHSALWTGRRSTRRQLEVLSVDLERARAAAHALGGTLNDLYVTGVLGGVGDYHRHFGVEVDDLRVSVPISTREDRSAGGNAFLPARLLLPAGIQDPVTRFVAVHERMATIKGQRASSAITDAVASMAASLPPGLILRLVRQQIETVDFGISNVRGSPVPLYIGGARIIANYPMGPTAGTACNITLLSYCSSMDIGINADTRAVEDPSLLCHLIENSLHEVMAAGS